MQKLFIDCKRRSNTSNHRNYSKNWIKGLDDKDFQEIAKECEEEVLDMWRTCVDEEKAWADYLFKDGAIIGLNEELLYRHVEYIANPRLKALGYKPIHDLLIPNPILDTTLVEFQDYKWLQETEVESTSLAVSNKM